LPDKGRGRRLTEPGRPFDGKNALRRKTDFASLLKRIIDVRPWMGNISLSFFQNSCIMPRIPPHPRGRFATVTSVERGPRWTYRCCSARARTNNTDTDGEVVWSWHPGADAKVAALTECPD
jgi:hypothetical protein